MKDGFAPLARTLALYCAVRSLSHSPKPYNSPACGARQDHPDPDRAEVLSSPVVNDAPRDNRVLSGWLHQKLFAEVLLRLVLNADDLLRHVHLRRLVKKENPR